MRVARILVGGVGVLILLGTAALLIGSYQDLKKSHIQTPQTTMKLGSPVFQNNQPIPGEFTCDGKDVNPSLTLADVPHDAKSFVLIVDDPDAPRGLPAQASDFVHWTLWNISPDTKEIAENSVPQGAMQGITDFGRPGYGGPCPPSGTHRYQFKLYALDRMLDLPATAKKSDIENAMQGHILDETILVGLYQRSI